MLDPTWPVRRPPPRIGTRVRSSPIPIRRLKNSSSSPGCPTENSPAFSRKNGRFSGKNRLNRSRLICWSSTSTCAKVGVVGQIESEARGHAVLQVRPHVSEQRGFAVRVAPERLAEHVGVQLEVPRRRSLHPLELAGQRQPVQVELAGQRRPVRLLVPMPDVALKVEPPRLHGARRVAQGPERNRELGGPADVGDLRGDLPDAVPVQVESTPRAALLLTPGPLHQAAADAAAPLPLVGQLSVVLEPGRVRAEHEPVLLVLVGVEDEPEAVGLDQRRVAPRVRDDDRRGVPDEADHPEVDRVVGVHDPHLGALGRRLALVGGVLAEPRLGARGGPGRLAEHVPVDLRSARDPVGPRDREPRRGRRRQGPHRPGRRRLRGGGNGGQARRGQRDGQDHPAGIAEQGCREPAARGPPACGRRCILPDRVVPRSGSGSAVAHAHCAASSRLVRQGPRRSRCNARFRHGPTVRPEAGRRREAASGAGSPPRRRTPPSAPRPPHPGRPRTSC